MSELHWLNLATVGVFGMILSASFCDIVWTRRRKLLMAFTVALILTCQVALYLFAGQRAVMYAYPLLTHVPLILALRLLCREWLWATVSVLTAYLYCQMRRWLALFVTAVFSGDALTQDIAAVMLTIPILFVLLWFASPKMREISHHTRAVHLQFGLVAALYYGFDYLTSVYTDLGVDGGLVVTEFMSFVCSVAYFLFAARLSEEERARSYYERAQESLNLQMEQAAREIENLREAQEKDRVHRHDLRHHLQYLSACLQNGRTEQAEGYIREISSQIEVRQAVFFCENEAASLILSAFFERADRLGIPMKVRAAIPQTLALSESDLCVLLSNALENALQAGQRRREAGLPASGGVEVLAYEKKGRFFLQIVNDCDASVHFVDGIPVTSRPGHGIGVRSICLIVERYQGIYDFSVEKGRFILRVSL